MKNRCDHIGKWVSILHRQFFIYASNALSKYNISSAQGMFLLMLYNQDGISQEELSEKLFIDKGATARVVKGLMKQKLLFRKVNADDKRAYQLYLTDKAFDIKSEVLNIFQQWEDIITDSIEEENQKFLKGNLRKMTDDAIKYNKKLR